MQGITTHQLEAARLTLSSGYLLGLGPGTEKNVTDIKGWYSPANTKRPSGAVRLNAHGVHSERGWKGARFPAISGAYRAPTRADAAAYVDELAAFLGDGEEGVLEVDDSSVGTRHANVYLIETDIDWRGGEDVLFTVSMEAPDSRKFGVATVTETGIALPGGGLQFNLFADPGVPGILDFGAAGNPGTATVPNPGTAPADPVLRVYGPTVTGGFTITEVETGRRLIYADRVPEGSPLILDARTGGVTLDGQDRSRGLIRAEWPTIPRQSSRTFLYESQGAESRLEVEAAPAWW